MTDTEYTRIEPTGGPVIIFEPAPDRMLALSILVADGNGRYAVTLNPEQVNYLAAQLNELLSMSGERVSELIDEVHNHNREESHDDD